MVTANSIWFGDTRGNPAFASFHARARDDAWAGSLMRKTLQFRKKRCNFPKSRMSRGSLCLSVAD
jgi:hypothetical protein